MNPSSASPAAGRVVWLDVVRLVAMYAVVCCHCCDPFNFCPDPNAPGLADIRYWGAVWGAALRPCVPLFVMITGTLLLPLRSEAGPFYKRRIPRVLWPMVIWSIAYALFPWLTGLLGLSPEAVRDVFPYSGDDALNQSLPVSLGYIARLPLNFSPLGVHFWYLYLLIGLYLYFPIFSAWVAEASERAKRWFLVAWGVTTLLPYYFEYVDPYIWGGCSWNAFHALYYFAGFNGYLLLGHYLRRHPISRRRLLLLWLPLAVAGYCITFFGFRHVTSLPTYDDTLLELFFTYNTLNVAVMTIFVFGLCQHVKVNSPLLRRLLANLTACGLGIYILHYFLAAPCVHLMRAAGIPLGLQVPAAAVIALCVTWAAVDLLRRLLGRHARYLIG